MPSDRLYDDIVRKLRTEQLDNATFEQIAVRVANSMGVRVLYMAGGQDAGYDGAIIDAEGGRLPGALVATLQENGPANLRRNLKKHLDTFPDAAKTAFFVTSRRKTNKQKQNLTDIADKIGYKLLGIADEPNVAEFLYYNPDSCYKLLGFRGEPSALSLLPPRRRAHWDVELVGRDGSLDRLRHLEVDAMLVGMPGSGKTSLLSHAAAENLGLFALTADRIRLAPGLREHTPKAVFVDGLENQHEAIQALVSLREESSINFRIVVTGWYEDDGIVELLRLHPDQRIRLDRLGLDELVEVVHRLGLLGPRELIKNIVHQAGGSPGLAATLTMACLDGNVNEVVTGAILLRQVRMSLRSLPLDEKMAEMALAVIAVGGDVGMQSEEVAKAIGMRPLELHRLLEDIEAGGVVRPRVEGYVSVQPELLRAILVGTNFWGTSPILVQPLLDIAPNRSAALRTLILAATTKPEPAELRTLLTVQDPSVFEAYAWLGPNQCRWVIEMHPEYLMVVSRAALCYIPEVVLPLMIMAAKGDVRQLHNTPEHPLRIISDWCQSAKPGEEDGVLRREMTVKAALQYLHDTGDVDTAARAFAQALTTEYETSYVDPGLGMTLTMEWSVLTPDGIEAVTDLWGRCLETIRDRRDLPWKILIDAAQNVVSTRPVNDEESVAESRVAQRRLGNTLARNIFELGAGHPGVAHEARQLTSEQEGWPPESEQEQLYSLLFGDQFGQDYREHEVEVETQLAALAEEWSRRDPCEAMAELSSLTAAAEEVRDGGMDRRRELSYQLSERVEVIPWLRAAIGRNLDYVVVMPLLRKAISLNAAGWEDIARSCTRTRSEAAMVEAALIAGGPSDLIAEVLPMLPKYVGLVAQVCIRKEVSPTALQKLLLHEDDRVASETAIHVWHGLKGNIDDAVKALWRDAILRSNGEGSWMGDILSADGDLAFTWTKRRIEAADWRSLRQDHTVQEAAKSLTEDQRVALLLAVSEPLRFHHLIGPLFGRLVEVFRRVLAAGGRERLCLMVFERPKDEVWAEFVVVAREHGMSVDNLARVSSRGSGSVGSKSANLKERIEQVAQFLDDPRGPVREVVTQITELLTSERERELTKECEERVWGL
jgi:hypothetical protein